MKYLYSHINEILEKIAASQKVVLLFDYDGTLTPIAKRPELARLSRASHRLLRSLKNKLVIGIISGRSLKDIKNLVGIPGIIYAGNHGLEIEIRGRVWRHPVVKGFSKRLNKISDILHQRLSHIPGVIVEHKGLTLSLHYRCVNRLHLAEVKHIFNDAVSQPVKRGKKVLEIRPPVEWHKGRAAEKIIRQVKGKVLPVYIGDDVTDEDAFKALKERGITIYVGRPKKSHARYFLRNVGEVPGFLKKVYEACKRPI